MSEQAFGRYRIRQMVGKGGMATVFLAFDPLFEREVALKVLPRQFLHDDSFQTRFQKEAKTIAALEHPAIVPVYDFGEEAGQPYLVMRYMAGGTLTNRLQESSLPFDSARDIAVRLAAALEEAHQRGIIHRDLKPDNILFDAFGNPYLSDFGIAKLAAQTQTLTQGIIGTPPYMSPEQWRGQGNLDGRCDQYAMGIILYQMLTGDLPFTAQETTGYMLAHVNDPVPDIEQELPVSPPGIGSFIQKTLAKRPGDRFASMTDWSAGLQGVGHGDLARETAEVAESDSTMPMPVADTIVFDNPDEPTAVYPTSPQAGGRFPWWGWLIGTLVLIAVVALAVLGNPLAAEPEPGTQVAAASTEASPLTATQIAAVETLETPSVVPSPQAALTPTEPPLASATATPAPFTPEPGLGFEWIEIPAGPFMMGAAETDMWAGAPERPLHEVDLPTFWISRFEVTNAQYLVFVQATGHPVPFRDRDDFPGVDDETYEQTILPYLEESNWNPKIEAFPAGKADHPVTVVSWSDAMAFAAWLSDETGNAVTLPSEAEWEKAARGAGEPLIYPWGSTFEGGRLNFCDFNCRESVRDAAINDGYFVTAPVGHFPSGASPYGVEDLAGNVWEWTRSAFTDGYPYNSANETDDLENPAVRVVRGGSWLNDLTTVRTSTRFGLPPTNRDGSTGFRVVIRVP